MEINNRYLEREGNRFCFNSNGFLPPGVTLSRIVSPSGEIILDRRFKIVSCKPRLHPRGFYITTIEILYDSPIGIEEMI